MKVLDVSITLRDMVLNRKLRADDAIALINALPLQVGLSATPYSKRLQHGLLQGPPRCSCSSTATTDVLMSWLAVYCINQPAQ